MTDVGYPEDVVIRQTETLIQDFRRQYDFKVVKYDRCILTF